MTGSPPRPAPPPDPRPWREHHQTPSHPEEPPAALSPPPTLFVEPGRQPQGPPAATRSGSARALTPTPNSTCAPRSKTAQIWGRQRLDTSPFLQGWPAVIPL